MKKIQIWHFLLSLTLLVIIMRFSELTGSLRLFYSFVMLAFNKTNIVNQFTFEIADQFISAIGIILLLVILLLLKERLGFFKTKLKPSNAIATAICFIFIFAPLIAVYNPNLQFDLSVAKSLSPLSSKVLVQIDENKTSIDNKLTRYYNQRMNLLRDVVDDKYFLCDSIKSNGKIKIFQKTKEFELQNVSGSKIDAGTIIFLFGTDEYGRDLFSRIIYATRLSTLIGISAVIVTLLIGGLLGFISGYFSRNVDILLNRFTEMLLAFPTIFLVILFLAYFGNSLLNVIIILGISGWKTLFKIVRGEVISLKHKNYIITSQLLGMSKLKLLRKDFLPLLLPSLLVNLVFQFANVVIAESSLSYLGLTGNHFYPTWGAMILEGQYYLNQAWWIAAFPSFFLVITLLSVYSLGKELQLKVNPFITD